MQKNILYAIIGLLAGLLIGFFVANSINRNAQIAVTPNNQTNAPFQNQQIQTTVVKDQPAQGGMIPAVQETLDKAKAAPNDFDAQIKAGDLYARIKSLDKAAEFFERAHQIKPEDYQTTVKTGNAYFDAGQFEQAQKFYEEALAKKPDDVNVRTDLGITFVERAKPDLDRAIREFQTSLQTNPKHEQTLYNLGIAYIEKGNFDETNKIISQLEATNPNSQLTEKLREKIR